MGESEGFEWDEANIEHIGLHDITPTEAEEAFANANDVHADLRNGEERMTSVGVTAKGRFLVLVTAMRGDRIRVVTAYNASKRLIEAYIRDRGYQQ